MERIFRGLERDDLETGDALEVLHVERRHIEAEIEGCGTDDKVLESDDIALGSLFAFDASCKLCDFHRYRMHDQVVKDSLGEDAPPCAVGVSSGPVDAVRQFHNADRRERNVDLAMSGPHLPEDVFDGLTTPFACDEDAGIEDQSQAVTSMPTYRGACGCG